MTSAFIRGGLPEARAVQLDGIEARAVVMARRSPRGERPGQEWNGKPGVVRYDSWSGDMVIRGIDETLMGALRDRFRAGELMDFDGDAYWDGRELRRVTGRIALTAFNRSGPVGGGTDATLEFMGEGEPKF